MTRQHSSRTRNPAIADTARRRLAVRAHDPAECRELGLLRGLMEAGPLGILVTADPRDADVGDPAGHSPREVSCRR